MPRMAKLAYLMANEKYDDLDEELDECLKRIRTARMVQNAYIYGFSRGIKTPPEEKEEDESFYLEEWF